MRMIKACEVMQSLILLFLFAALYRRRLPSRLPRKPVTKSW